MKKKPIEHHQTLREKILETIRESILKGQLKPGEKVAEPELAERFGISRTPIREAFRQLESEGYLTVIPRKGAVVTMRYFAGLTVEEIASVLGLSVATVEREWRFARARLLSEMGGSGDSK